MPQATFVCILFIYFFLRLRITKVTKYVFLLHICVKKVGRAGKEIFRVWGMHFESKFIQSFFLKIFFCQTKKLIWKREVLITEPSAEYVKDKTLTLIYFFFLFLLLLIGDRCWTVCLHPTGNSKIYKLAIDFKRQVYIRYII